MRILVGDLLKLLFGFFVALCSAGEADDAGIDGFARGSNWSGKSVHRLTNSGAGLLVLLVSPIGIAADGADNDDDDDRADGERSTMRLRLGNSAFSCFFKFVLLKLTTGVALHARSLRLQDSQSGGRTFLMAGHLV